jgi:predicted DNA binding CopG/RHH family protein
MKKKLKKIPRLLTDRQAERFLERADLSEYDLSGFRLVHFEFEPKNRTVSVRMPESLYKAVKKKAATRGIKPQRLIRQALEQAVG